MHISWNVIQETFFLFFLLQCYHFFFFYNAKEHVTDLLLSPKFLISGTSNTWLEKMLVFSEISV